MGCFVLYFEKGVCFMSQSWTSYLDLHPRKCTHITTNFLCVMTICVDIVPATIQPIFVGQDTKKAFDFYENIVIKPRRVERTFNLIVNVNLSVKLWLTKLAVVHNFCNLNHPILYIIRFVARVFAKELKVFVYFFKL